MVAMNWNGKFGGRASHALFNLPQLPLNFCNMLPCLCRIYSRNGRCSLTASKSF